MLQSQLQPVRIMGSAVLRVYSRQIDPPPPPQPLLPGLLCLFESLNTLEKQCHYYYSKMCIYYGF